MPVNIPTMWTISQLKTAPQSLADFQEWKVAGYLFSDTELGRKFKSIE